MVNCCHGLLIDMLLNIEAFCTCVVCPTVHNALLNELINQLTLTCLSFMPNLNWFHLPSQLLRVCIDLLYDEFLPEALAKLWF